MLIISNVVVQDMQCAVDFPVFILSGQFAVASGQGIQRTVGHVQQCINFCGREFCKQRVTQKVDVLSLPVDCGESDQHHRCNDCHLAQMCNPRSSGVASDAVVVLTAAPAAARFGVIASATTRLGANLIPARAKASWILA